MLKWKEMFNLAGMKTGDRAWGAVQANTSYMKTYVAGRGWDVSYHTNDVSIHHPGNPFMSEAEAEEAINRIAQSRLS